MSKPRILIFTTSYHPFIGGAEVAIQEITRRLKERFDFYIVTSRFKRDLPKNEVRTEGTVIRVGLGTRFDKYFLIFTPFYYRGFASIVLGVDISHASIAAAIYKILNPKTHFIFNIQFGESENHLSFGRAGIISMAFRFMLSQADFVTAISSYLLDLARSYGYQGPTEVVPNGVDIQKFQSTNSKLQINSKTQNTTPKTIITTSRLVPKNGVDILIKAMAEVKKKIPEILLHIMGEGAERRNLELEIRNLKLEDNVKLFGQVPYEEIPRYLHKASLFVRPSRSEGMGNSFVEALAAGLPIIGTPVGGITDIIEDEKTGLFCNPEDPRDLAEKIMRLLRDQNLSAVIVSEGKKMVEEKFSWDKIAQAYAELLSKFSIYSNEDKPMRILIATPILPPQLGGPAQYAQNLLNEFLSLGQKAKVISFGGYLRFPSGIRHLFYFGALLKNGLRADLIFSLDYSSVGIPAALASLILRKPLVIRVEGDFLWESYVERTRRDITLSEFYKSPPLLSRKETLVRWLSGWVMRRATKLVFSSEWRRKMVIDAFKLSSEKTLIIQNVFPFEKGPDQKPRGNNIILWAGRVLYLKNLEKLIRAFADIKVSSYELHLVGEGPEKSKLEQLIKEYRAEDRIKFFPPMSHHKLMGKLVLSKGVVLPSLSDVGPNIVAEAIANLVPVIMTKESGYAEIFRENVILVNPLDENELHYQLEKFMKEPAARTVPNLSFIRSWHAAAGNWLELFKIL